MFMLCDPIKEMITIKNDSYVLIPDTSKRICVAIIGPGCIVYNKKKDEDGADKRVISEKKHERLVVDGQYVVYLTRMHTTSIQIPFQNTCSHNRYISTRSHYREIKANIIMATTISCTNSCIGPTCIINVRNILRSERTCYVRHVTSSVAQTYVGKHTTRRKVTRVNS